VIAHAVEEVAVHLPPSGVILATGGLGPTHDDLTREGVADALGEALAPDPGMEAVLRERFGGVDRMPVANLRQALIVPSAEALPNPIGSAPGWWVDRGGAVLALMPGVPSEMRRMFVEQVRPRLERRFALVPLQARTVKTMGLGESAVAELLGDLLESPGDGIRAGIYARDDGVHLRFSTQLEASVLEGPVERALSVMGADAWGTDADTLAGVALEALGGAGAATLASWEADTEGALLSILAAAPAVEGAATFVGGLLDAGGSAAAPMADAVLQLSLLPQDASGRSRVRVAVSGIVQLAPVELRIHGSGPQRLRRAAFAALDQVRRALT
jgi:nicotinamide-nucleotide amidase